MQAGSNDEGRKEESVLGISEANVCLKHEGTGKCTFCCDIRRTLVFITCATWIIHSALKSPLSKLRWTHHFLKNYHHYRVVPCRMKMLLEFSAMVGAIPLLLKIHFAVDSTALLELLSKTDTETCIVGGWSWVMTSLPVILSDEWWRRQSK